MTRPPAALFRAFLLFAMFFLPAPLHSTRAGQMLNASIPGTAEKMRRLMGGGYTVIDRDELLIVSDLDQKTLYQLMSRDFLIYMNVLKRDFYTRSDKPAARGGPAILTVFLFRNRESYVAGLRKIGIDIAREDENDQGAVRNGYFFGGRERNFILINYRDDYDRGMATYAHELSHALLRKEFAGAPLWLNEGLATMVGNSRVINSHLRYNGDSASLARLKRRLEEKSMPPLEVVLRAGSADFSAREGSTRFYDASEQFCRFLHSRHQLLPLYRDLRDARGRGGDGEIIARLTGLAPGRLEEAWHGWLRSQK